MPPSSGGPGGYGPTPPGGYGGYGQTPPGGPGGPPPPYGPPGGGEPPASIGAAIGAIVANVVGLCGCTVLSVIGLVLGVIAAVTYESSPQASRICTTISYVLFGVGVVLAIIMFLIYGGAGMWSLMQEDSYTGY
ncbi:hypothetical protein [Nocardiopsis sp. Huas11]|uniref:hypothetical protein n=1 Tax=Nocardiopsis sp. Huas11 TaxID=2183912 RepID=UPI001F430981|nr:hypothetical protein [Nocardiopsis sp. Huas11]